MLYPIGVQDFGKLIQGGFVYVDKTAMVHRLASTGCYYFLRRPRRFGKSLLISTMEAYFSGKKELFRGLAMEKLEQNWTAFPIFHLDLNTGKYDTPEALRSTLNKFLLEQENLYGTEEGEDSLELRFLGLVRRACEKTGRQVVILVDEYDKPMLQAIGNDALQDEYRATLKAFYSVLKTQDRYIRFAFLTGVTKFGKVSVFSDLNNLNDISMDDAYIEICGISEQELRTYFDPSVCDVENGDAESFLSRLQTLFDDAGYRVSGKMEKYFQNAFYVVFKMMGFYTEVERAHSRGRIDVVVKTKNYIYVIELKLDGSEEEALSQIEEKGYAAPLRPRPAQTPKNRHLVFLPNTHHRRVENRRIAPTPPTRSRRSRRAVPATHASLSLLTSSSPPFPQKKCLRFCKSTLW